jgi:allantoate deiminase
MQQTESIALASEGSVRGTVGWVEAWPGAENVIPDSVQLSIDLRSLDEEALMSAVARVKAEMRAVSQSRGLTFEVMTEHYTAPVMLDYELLSHLERVASDLGLLHSTLASGGGHDAMIMQSVCPTAMVFVRSKDGLSHCPEEYSSPEDLAAGTELLLRGVAKATRVQLG